MSTIHDVARAANVSVATVSRVMNNEPHVREALRQLVTEAISRLDYRPVRTGRSLRKRRSQTIGMLLPDVVNPGQVAMLRGACDRAVGTGYIVMLGSTEGAPERELSFIDEMIAERVTGVICIPQIVSPQNIRLLLHGDIATVALARASDAPEIDSVLADNVEGGRTVARHLIELGHRSIAIFSGPQGVTALGERKTGTLQALTEVGITVDPTNMVDAIVKDPAVAERRLQGMLGGRHRPTAIVVYSVRSTVAVLDGLRRIGAGPPEVSVVCIEHDWSRLFSPPLTTLEQPSYAMGAEAMGTLLAQIDSRGSGEIHRVPMNLIVRDSTAAPVGLRAGQDDGRSM